MASLKLEPKLLFNQDIYRRLLERQAGGQPVELGFLAGDVDEEGMGYLSRMVRDALSLIHILQTPCAASSPTRDARSGPRFLSRERF